MLLGVVLEVIRNFHLASAPERRTPARAAPSHALTKPNIARPAWPPKAPPLLRTPATPISISLAAILDLLILLSSRKKKGGAAPRRDPLKSEFLYACEWSLSS